MVWTSPVVRDCSILAGDQTYAEPNSILDLSLYRRTASVAGANGRIVQVGDQIFEANDLTKPVRLMGNNNGAVITHALDEAVAWRMAMKLKTRGFNFIRLHHIEAYLSMWGEKFASPDTTVKGTRNYDPRRWAELDAFLYALKQAGIFYSFGPASKNLAMNLNGGDRWNSVFNVTGTATATITNGKITNVVPLVLNAVKYPEPPSVLPIDKAGSNGRNAVIRAVLNAGGDIVSYAIDDQGDGYTADNGTPNGTSITLITHYGGTGRANWRVRFDDVVKQHLLDVHYDFLYHVSPHTGIPYWQEPALAMVEVINEAHMANLIGSYTTGAMRPRWVNHLFVKYGTIADLNSAWGGATYTGFWDVPLLSSANFPAGTQPSQKHFAECIAFINLCDKEFYKYFIDKIKETGYQGLTVCRDMAADPIMSYLYTETGANMQSMHAYPGWMDSFTTGYKYQTSAANANAPSHYAYGTNPMWLCLPFITENVPWMFGEFGFPWPGVYRGEWGILGAGYASSHGASAICLHGENYNVFNFGPGNRTGLKALRPYQYERDPNGSAGSWLMSKVFQNYEVATLPITKVNEFNHRAVNSFPTKEAIAAATVSYSFTINGVPAAYQVAVPTTRQVQRWNTAAPNDTTIATNWRNQILKNTESLLNDHGFNIGNAAQYEMSDWIYAKGNNLISGNYEYPVAAMRYSKRVNNKPAEVFSDRVAGLLGLSVPTTQAMVCSAKYVQSNASHVRKGNQFISNITKLETGQPGFRYETNLQGNRFFENLTVDYIEDGTLFAVTSMDGKPIYTSERMIVLAASNYYNTGQTFAPCDKNVVSMTLTGGTGYPDVTEWTLNEGTRAAASVRVISVGGVPTSYKILSQTDNFTSTALTVTRVGSGAGTGLTIGGFVLADAPESNEIQIGQPFGGTEEGWPILQKTFSVVGRLKLADVVSPWVIYELDFAGNRVQAMPTEVVDGELRIVIDSWKTIKPTPYFELVKGDVSRKAR